MRSKDFRALLLSIADVSKRKLIYTFGELHYNINMQADFL